MAIYWWCNNILLIYAKVNKMGQRPSVLDCFKDMCQSTHVK